ncbi:hypothetical protein HMPREF0372_01137 [Flavonifractor plautii ATCC 29863]|uniref:Uncharacterized protein n=1 Tax=Flavonifractor plautii ATCC 29863 TaxID=411475 RepID=G9YNR0_FLAPL|nr:hypothetical protein HMPREF0372_01137 [Flavonifractor plautii ATCC 29863]
MVGIVILQLSICRRVAQNATALFCYLQLNIRRPTVAHEAVNLKPICCFFVVCLANFQMPSSKE